MKHRSHVGAALIAMAIVFLGSCPSPAGLAGVEGDVEFSYDDPYAGSVAVAGDFNGWSMEATQLEMDEEGMWRVVVDIEPGQYGYKFVVNGSQWIADPDNPKLVGDYGNSELVVGDDGEPVVSAGGVEVVSNTGVSSRVKLDGWYRATYQTVSQVPSDPRWRLERPEHEVFLGINPTVNQQVKGNATLRLNTGMGDIKELAAEFYSGNINLIGGPFSVLGYYNEEEVQFDNPIEQLGHIDLRGTITTEHIPFGRGTQGIKLDTDIGGSSLQLVYSNVHDYSIYNDPLVYDNTGTDVIGARFKWPTGPVTLGATWTSERDAWWVKYGGENAIPELDDYIDQTGSTSDWFELVTANQLGGVDVFWPALGELLGLHGEFAYYSYRAKWDMGNKEKIEGTDLSNGEIDVPVGSTDGRVGKLRMTSTPAPPAWLRLDVTYSNIDGMNENEEFISFWPTPWGIEPRRQYTDVGWDGSPLVLDVYGPAPVRKDWLTEFDGRFTLGIFDALLEFDAAWLDWTYRGSYLGGDPDTAFQWKGESNRFAFMAKADMSGDKKLWTDIRMEVLDFSFDEEGTVIPYDSFEFILRGEAGFNPSLSMLADLRVMSYDHVPDADGTGYHYKTFGSAYVALIWAIRENIQARVYYGVDPSSYVDTPVEGRGNGRERWRSQYRWTHGEADEIDAEQALSNARPVGIMAVLTF